MLTEAESGCQCDFAGGAVKYSISSDDFLLA
jgi:hypothetical protein